MTTYQSTAYRVRQLFSTLATAAASNPVLLEGEKWNEKDPVTGRATGRTKTGDGVVTGGGTTITGTAFNDLPFDPGTGGSGEGGASLSNVTPQALGAATAGTATTASRGDHRHALPSAAQVGADATGTAAAAVAAHLAAADPHPVYTTAAEAAAVAPVQSVALSLPNGWSTSSTNTGGSVSLTLGLPMGFSLPSTASQTQWDTAYSVRGQWTGGAAGLVAATGRASLELGSAATTAAADYATAAQGALAASAVQPGTLAASATTDTTNANNISSGTLQAARLPTSGVAAGSYGSGSLIPVLTIDAAGRVTAASTAAAVSGGGRVRCDASAVTTIYIGRAVAGTSESATGWTITRTTYSALGVLLTTATASGAWTSRASLTYT